jgi:hypothetical protein
MRRRQLGVSLMALILGFAVLVIVAIFGMKVVPSFLEYRAAKAAVEILGRTGGSPADIRRAWESRSAIDNITTVSAKDLEITREGNQTVVAFAYRKEVPLFGNVGLYIDYAASSKGSQ